MRGKKTKARRLAFSPYRSLPKPKGWQTRHCILQNERAQSALPGCSWDIAHFDMRSDDEPDNTLIWHYYELAFITADRLRIIRRFCGRGQARRAAQQLENALFPAAAAAPRLPARRRARAAAALRRRLLQTGHKPPRPAI